MPGTKLSEQTPDSTGGASDPLAEHIGAVIEDEFELNPVPVFLGFTPDFVGTLDAGSSLSGKADVTGAAGTKLTDQTS